MRTSRSRAQCALCAQSRTGLCRRTNGQLGRCVLALMRLATGHIGSLIPLMRFAPQTQLARHCRAADNRIACAARSRQSVHVVAHLSPVDVRQDAPELPVDGGVELLHARRRAARDNIAVLERRDVVQVTQFVRLALWLHLVRLIWVRTRHCARSVGVRCGALAVRGSRLGARRSMFGVRCSTLTRRARCAH